MTLRQLSLGRPRPPTHLHPATALLLGPGALLGAALLFGALASGLVVPLSLCLAGGAMVYVAWRWPLPTAIGLMALLPLSRFLSFVAFAATDSAMVLRASQLWKDVVLVTLLARVCHEAFGRRQAPRLYFMDILMVAYVSLVGVYILYPGDQQQSSLLVRLLAFRQDAFYLLAYFVGRGLSFERRHPRQMLLVLGGTALLIAAVALWQWLAPELSNGIFQALGYTRFTEAVGTPHEVELVRKRLLSAGELPRASSLFLSDLGLAFFQVLMVPLAAGLLACVRGRRDGLLAGLFLLAMLGALGLTLSRAPMIAAALGLGVVILVSRRFGRFLGVAAATAVLVALFVLVSGLGLGALSSMFSPQESSAFAHREYIRLSMELVQGAILGHGLGYGSHVSILASNIGTGALPAWATETWYLQLGLEMGPAAVLLFSLLLTMATLSSLLTAFRVRDLWLRSLTLGVAGAGIGFMVVGAFHPVWAAVQVSALFWLFAGCTVRAHRLEKEWERGEGGQR